MRDYHINIFYSEDDEGYIADIPDLEECSAFGETPDDAHCMRFNRLKNYGWRLHEQRVRLFHRHGIVRLFIRQHQPDSTDHIHDPEPKRKGKRKGGGFI